VRAAAIGHQLDRPEQAAAPDIADVAVVAEALGQAMLEVAAKLLDAVEQLFLGDDPLHLERGGAGEGMGEIGVSVLERARACRMVSMIRPLASIAPIGW